MVNRVPLAVLPRPLVAAHPHHEGPYHTDDGDEAKPRPGGFHRQPPDEVQEQRAPVHPAQFVRQAGFGTASGVVVGRFVAARDEPVKLGLFVR